MQQQPGSWHALAVPPAVLRLPATLLSGMSFRWHPLTPEPLDTDRWTQPSFVGVLGHRVYELSELPDSCRWRLLHADEPNEAEAESALRQHLRLDVGPSDAQLQTWSSAPQVPPEYTRAARGLPGVRVLSVEILECLVAFLGSANNTIKRNMQMVASLCSAFPQNLLVTDSHGTRHYSFPSVAQLLSVTEKELWELGWGYRAPRLYKLVRELDSRGGVSFLEALDELPDTAARQCLCELTGVGRKVADCVLLFGYGRDAVVPVDTHCFQLAQRSMLPQAIDKSLSAGLYTKIVSRFHQVDYTLLRHI